MQNTNQKQPNALKHGAFSKIAIIPGEDPQEFKELHSALIEEWGPVGPTEEDTVLTIATGIWRKRRHQKLIQAAISSGTLSPTHPAYDEAFALEFFSEWIEDKPDDNVTFHVLKNITADHLRQKFPRQKFETSLEWVRAIQEEITTVLLPRVEHRSEPSPDVCLVRYVRRPSQHDPFEQFEIATDARIDAMIDRAVKRLVQTKAIKQMLGTTSPDARAGQTKKLPSNKPEGSAKIVTKKQNGGRRSGTGTQRADPPGS